MSSFFSFDIEEAQDMVECDRDTASLDPWRPIFKALPGSRIQRTPCNYVQELVGEGKSIQGIRVESVRINFTKTVSSDAPAFINKEGKIYVRLPWDPANHVGKGDYVSFQLEADESCQMYYQKVPCTPPKKTRKDKRFE